MLIDAHYTGVPCRTDSGWRSSLRVAHGMMPIRASDVGAGFVGFEGINHTIIVVVWKLLPDVT
jgi:hypothetical protein